MEVKHMTLYYPTLYLTLDLLREQSMVLKPRKDAVRLVRRYLEKTFGLEVVKAGLSHAPGHLTIKPSNTVIHVKGIQQESDSKSNEYYPRSFDYLKKGNTQFLVLVRYDKDNLGDSFILPLKTVERIFGGLNPQKKVSLVTCLFSKKLKASIR
jgi:hypothetical protein